MFSGKSRTLLRRIAAALADGTMTVAFKHALDDRYGPAGITTHDGERFEAIAVRRAMDIPSGVGDARLVVIDEAQFFDSDLVGVCRELAGRGCNVVVAGLDRDSWGLPFEPVPSLEAIADRVIRTRATCARCGHEADFTQRLTAVEGTLMVGGADRYEPRCKSCFQPPPLAMRC